MEILKLAFRFTGTALLFFVLIPVVILWVLLWGLVWLLLVLAVWILWIPKGKNTLFVYSESPNWHDHLQENVIPRVNNQAVILNWSERRKWQSFPHLIESCVYVLWRLT